MGFGLGLYLGVNNYRVFIFISNIFGCIEGRFELGVFVCLVLFIVCRRGIVYNLFWLEAGLEGEI